MIRAAPKEKEQWLRNLLIKSIDESSLIKSENLGKADILLWRGIEAEPYYYPPPTLVHKEGNSEVDVTIKIPEEAIVFVEAKYKSPISKRTKNDPDRDQIIRNLDVGSYYATKNNFGFYFILLTEKGDDDSIKLYNYYKSNPQNIINKLPHRTNIIKVPTYFENVMGYITWDELPTRTFELVSR